MPFWTTKSTTFENGVTYVGGTSAWKDSNGNNKLTTISSSNPTGFVKVNANSNDSIVKNLEYAIQNDGKITYRYGPSGGQFNSIQEVANSLQGYNANTTKLIKDSMRKNLSSSANEYNKKNPDTKVGPSVPPAAAGADPTDPTDPNGANATTDFSKQELGKVDGTGRSSYGGQMTYPLDLASSPQDKIKFEILKYDPRSFNLASNENLSGFGDRSAPSTRSIGTIYLPIPGGISDTNSVDWGDDSMDPFAAVLAQTALQSMSKGLSEGAGVLAAAANAATGPDANPALKNQIENQFAAAAIQGDAGRLLSRTQGSVLNPNLELLFKGPQLRSFNFTFKMSARNEPEADMIVKIIRSFKQAMAPQKTKSQLFIKAPNTFKVSYLHAGQEGHKRIGRIKECALLSLQTNYTPEGQYATYYDGTPTSYEIQLQFKELEPVFNEDYSDDNDQSIGF